MKKTLIILLLLTFVSSCETLKDAEKVLRNEKVNSTDEFLVKKREPLVYPPEYDRLPKPGEKKQKNKDENEKIKKILKLPQEKINDESNSSVEQSIINKIK